MNGKYIKNLYQVISTVASILFIDSLFLVLIIGYYCGRFEDFRLVELAVIGILALTLSSFVFGFYWAFQVVIINENGITIKIFNHVIRSVEWKSIKKMTYTNLYKNPTITLIVKGERNLNLDRRTKIIKIVNYYLRKEKEKNGEF